MGDWALRWTEGNETVQVFFVMLFFPVIMNALQYYIIDGFIKDQKPGDHEPIPSDDGEESDDEGDRRARRRRSRGPDQGLDGTYENDEDESVKAAAVSDKGSLPDGVAKLRSDPKKIDEYDPANDGERGSSSGSSTRARDEAASPSNNLAVEAKKT